MYQEMEAIAVMSISKHKNTTSISAFCLTEIVMTFCAMSLSDPRAERETKPSYLVFWLHDGKRDGENIILQITYAEH